MAVAAAAEYACDAVVVVVEIGGGSGDAAAAAAPWSAWRSASPRGRDASAGGLSRASSRDPDPLGSGREWERRRRRSAGRSSTRGGTAARLTRASDRFDMAGRCGDSTSGNSIPAT